MAPAKAETECVAELGSFNKFIHHDLSPEVKSKMKDWVDERTEIGSKIAQFGSHRAHAAAMFLYHNREPVPVPKLKAGKGASIFVNHCFNRYLNAKGSKVPTEALEEFENWPMITNRAGQTPKGQSNLVKVIADRWATNATNYFEVEWQNKLELVVRTHLKVYDLDMDQYGNTKYIMAAMKDPKAPYLFLDEWDQEIIDYQRSFFKDYNIPNAVLNEAFVAKNSSMMMLLFAHWQARQEYLDETYSIDTKKIPVVPLHNGRGSVPFTSSDLYYMAKDLGDDPRHNNGKAMKYDDFMSPRYPQRGVYWRKYFAVEKYSSPRRSFNEYMGFQINFIGASMIFNKTKPAAESTRLFPNTAAMLMEKYDTDDEEADEDFELQDNDGDNSDEDDSDDDDDNSIKPLLPYYDYSSDEEEADDDEANEDNEELQQGDEEQQFPRRIQHYRDHPPTYGRELDVAWPFIEPLDHYTVAVDPGRVRIVHAIKFDREGKVVEIIDLLRAEYYDKGKIKPLNSKRKKWAKRMQASAEAKSLHSMKTVNIRKFRLAKIALLEYYESDWDEWNNNCWRRTNLYGRGQKRSVLRKTLNRLDVPGERVVVAYGDGNVAATAKNELAVPTKEVKNMCSALYKTVETNEWGTSQGCPDCGGQLFPQYIIYDGLPYDNRGQKTCGSWRCRGCCNKHREDTGSFGIFEGFKHQEYGVPLPPILDQAHPIQAQKKNTKKLANQYRQAAPHTNVSKQLRKKLKKRKKAEKRQRRRERDSAAREAADQELED